MFDDFELDAMAAAYAPPVDSVDSVDFAAEYAAAVGECVAGENAEIAALAGVPVPRPVLSSASVDDLVARGVAVDGDLPKDGRLRWWEIVFWSESVADGWVDRLRARPDVRALVICHDKDLKDASTGELKKSHFHCMAGDSHGRKWSRSQALRFARSVFGLRAGKDDGLVRPIKSPSGYALYLTHSNAPGKTQYPRDAVMAFGGADLDAVVGVVDSRSAIVSEIYNWVDEFRGEFGALPSFAAVSRFAQAVRPGWARLLSTSAGGRQIKGYLTSLEYDLGLDCRGANTMGVILDMIDAEKSGVEVDPAKLHSNRLERAGGRF